MVVYRDTDVNVSDSRESLAKIIETHQAEILYNDYELVASINIRRKHLWVDSVLQFVKRSFDPRKSIRVIFHGEEAEDGGGPKREYFRLLSKSIKEDSGCFFSNCNVINFRPDVSLVHDHRFHLIGTMVATAILHAGVAFPFLPKCVYNYIAKEQNPTVVSIADVANSSTLHVLNSVSEHGVCGIKS